MSDDPTSGTSAKNFVYLGYSDQGGYLAAVQVMVKDGFAYLGQPNGLGVLDVSDPRDMKPVLFRPVTGPKTWCGHLQVSGDLLLVSEEVHGGYFPRGVPPRKEMFGEQGCDFSAGIRVYDISQPSSPREISFFPVEGCGVHRMWFDGGRYVYCSALLDGYTDAIFLVVDIDDPSHPQEVGRWWVSGMWADGGEEPTWSGHYALHHPIVKNGTAYCAWRDAGMIMLDVNDPARPRLISHTLWSPPFGGNTHNCLPLTDRALAVVVDEAHTDQCADGIKYTWLFDIREPSRPVSISTLPVPSERDFCAELGRFGPHNIQEHRTGSWQDSSTVFVAYQNAGLRSFDISNPFQPRENGYFVPAPSIDKVSGRTLALQSADVYVTPEGTCFLSDTARGLFALQYIG